MFSNRTLRTLVAAAADLFRSRGEGGPSNARLESNAWLRKHCSAIRGKVLSIGSGDDSDGEGGVYRDYFAAASSYTTSEVSADFDCELILDIRAMPEIADGSFDCIYCSGVLEHVDDFQAGLAEITRILADGGILLLGLPFRQAIHLAPNDYWRFTEFGIRHLLRDAYDIEEIAAIDAMEGSAFPATYWTKATKTQPDRVPAVESSVPPGIGAV